MSLPSLIQEERLQLRWQQALASTAFQDAGIDLAQLRATLAPARARSLQRLLQAVLREALIEADFQPNEAGAATLVLRDGTRLRAEHLMPGRMDSWDLRGAVWLQRPGARSEAIRWPSQLLIHLSEHLVQPPGREALQRLAEELDDSLVNDTLCLAFNAHWSASLQAQHPGQGLLAGMRLAAAPANPTLQLEQWGTLGHPWHPNYKTKLGLDTSRLISYAPEFAARVLKGRGGKRLLPAQLQAFTLVTTLAAVLFMFVWSLILLAWLAYRRNRPERHAASAFRLPGGRWVCYGVLAFFAAVLVLLTLQDDTRQALLASPLWFLLLGVGYWWRGQRQA